MPRPRPQARRVGPNEARAYFAKAHEFLQAARDSLELSNHTAAVGNAVHAGFSAGDALSAVRTGTVWRGEHAMAAGHLEDAGDKAGKRRGTLGGCCRSRPVQSTSPRLCDGLTPRPRSRLPNGSSDSRRRPSPP